MNRKPLPIGTQTFREMCEGGLYYADKFRAEGLPIHRIGVVETENRKPMRPGIRRYFERHGYR